MKLGKLLLIVVLIALLGGISYALYTFIEPYWDTYMDNRNPVIDDIPAEEKIVSVVIDNTSPNLSTSDGQMFFEFFEGEVDLASVQLVLTYGDNRTEVVTLKEEMISSNYDNIGNVGVNSIIVDVGGAQVIITIKVIEKVEEVRYTISFNSMGGTPINSRVSGLDGNISALPSNTTREGFAFAGWYTTADYTGSKVITPYKISQDITLYAKWTDLRNYNVTFLDKDGNVLKIHNVEHGSNATPPAAPQIEGWTFLGWDESQAHINVTEDKVIQAIYQRIMRQITFRSAVWGVGNDHIISIGYGDSLHSSYIPQVPNMVGYNAYWDRLVFNEVKNNIVVNAIYEIKVFVVTYWAEDWNESDYHRINVNYGQSVPNAQKPSTPAEKTGYTVAWDSTVDTDYVTQDLFIKAIYTPRKYRVNFREPNVGGHVTLLSIQADYDSTVAPYYTGHDPEDYDVNWYFVPSPTENDLPVNFDTYIIKGDVTFYVKITDKREYPVHFVYDLNDGQGEQLIITAVVTGYGNSALPYAPVPPVIQGYTFIGWSSFNMIITERDTVIKANYSINSYLVRYFDREGLISQVSLTYNTVIHTIPQGYDTSEEARPGFVFDGWYTSPIYAIGTEVNFASGYTLKGAINFYARWVNLDTGSDGLVFNYVQVSEFEAYYEIVNYTAYTDLEVKTPSTYEGFPVKGIASGAFALCYDILSIELPAELEYIGEGAFANNYSLQSFIISEDALNYKTINGVLYSKDGSVLIRYPIAKNTAPQSFEVPDTVTEIYNGAFAFVFNLVSVTFAAGSQVNTIGDSAFMGCFSLESINLPGTLTTIGQNAFKDSIILNNITGGSNLQFIGKDAFFRTAWMNNQSGNYVVIANALIQFRGQGAVDLNDSITAIADNAFAYSHVTSFTVLDTSQLAFIGNEAFRNCYLLENIKILTEDMPFIGANAFAGIAGNATLTVSANAYDDFEANPNIVKFVNSQTLYAIAD